MQFALVGNAKCDDASLILMSFTNELFGTLHDWRAKRNDCKDKFGCALKPQFIKLDSDVVELIGKFY